MLNAYYKEYRTFVNNELAGTEGSVILCEEGGEFLFERLIHGHGENLFSFLLMS